MASSLLLSKDENPLNFLIIWSSYFLFIAYSQEVKNTPKRAFFTLLLYPLPQQAYRQTSFHFPLRLPWPVQKCLHL